MGMSNWGALVSVLVLAGCGRGRQAEPSRTAGGTTGQTDTSAMQMGHMDSGAMKVGHMDSSGMGMQGMQMMSGMRAHMDSMMKMSPQQMQGTMAMHQSMMSQMMDQMGADMRGMKMSSTPAWNALNDSVKQDLAELPDLNGQALATRMRAHADRVKRLITMHEGMMGK